MRTLVHLRWAKKYGVWVLILLEWSWLGMHRSQSLKISSHYALAIQCTFHAAECTVTHKSKVPPGEAPFSSCDAGFSNYVPLTSGVRVWGGVLGVKGWPTQSTVLSPSRLFRFIYRSLFVCRTHQLLPLLLHINRTNVTRVIICLTREDFLLLWVTVRTVRATYSF